eukprot:1643789-Rhodomonas_salina.1
MCNGGDDVMKWKKYNWIVSFPKQGWRYIIKMYYVAEVITCDGRMVLEQLDEVLQILEGPVYNLMELASQLPRW